MLAGPPRPAVRLGRARPTRMKILVVEDEQKVADALREGLEAEKYEVIVERTGEAAFFRVNTETFDAVLLDLGLPGRDGLEILRAVRARGLKTPVLVLTARDSLQDRVTGLDSGADDYLVKPFAFAELTARIRALLRRHSDLGETVVQIGDLKMDLATRTVARSGKRINLTPKEFSLLEYLVRNRGNVLTRTMIAEHVWGYHFDSFSNVIDVCIRSLRAKIDDAFQTKLIHTIRGVGYLLSEEAP